ncbi:UNVERIFIED_CONTAM: putative ribonuclease H protein [Sesamum latifolium]|uniref:Ribonuclease H protein n=1 Tax=Sesamum latifolium TaxID=2727402 RepID=A0AAW2Y5D5_9LAMI
MTIVKRVKSHLELLYKANGVNAAEWKGDLDVASTLGFFFPKPAITIPQLIQWRQPSVGWFKLNSDGASRGNPGMAGGGGGDHSRLLGRLVLAFYDYLEEQTNTYAELYAVARGISLAKDVGCQHLWVEIDALAVIHIINNDNGEWRLQPQIRRLKREMQIIFTHTYREANRPGNFLANEACRMKTSEVMTTVSGYLAGLVCLDSLLPAFRFKH